MSAQPVDYQEFLAKKKITSVASGFEVDPQAINPMLFDFQRDIVRWALRQGRAAIFADCGLGKSFMQLEWAKHVSIHTGKPVLILAPLAVSGQTVREGAKLGIEVAYRRKMQDCDGATIIITNYEMMEHFDPSLFSGVVIDESSILKSYTGEFRNSVIERFGQTSYKLACTATPAPNDFMELGNHSEFLGNLTRTEMLSTFFVHDGGDTAKWRIKGHAAQDYWEWIASWAVMFGNPADLGYDGSRFVLPKLHYHHHVVSSGDKLKLPGQLFPMPANTMQERRQARSASTDERVAATERIISETWTRMRSENTTASIVSPIESEFLSNSEYAMPLTQMPIERMPESGKKITPTRKTLLSEDISQITRKNDAHTCEIDTPKNAMSLLKKIENVDGHTATLNAIGICELNTESDSNSTTLCSQNKITGARSVDEQKQNLSQSIIATPPDMLEGCCAQNAIRVSGNSRTARICSPKPSPIFQDQFIVWCNLNIESHLAAKSIPGAVEVTGSDSQEHKEKTAYDFAAGKIRVLVTKPSILGFGLNFQSCSNVVFLGLNDSFESFYQAIRRTHRFGQTREVHCHIVTSDLEGAVVENIQRKEAQAKEMAENMVAHMHSINEQNIRSQTRHEDEYKVKTETGIGFTAYLGDSVEVLRDVPTDSIHYSIFSPPFASLYTYSASTRDMGNCRNHAEFFEQFQFLTQELHRVMMPGRLLSFHCMNLPLSKERDGIIGITDFRGDLIRAFVQAGFVLHSEVTIWKDPVTAMQRTKALGLLHKQVMKDSCMSRQGIADYLVTIRKPGVNPERVAGKLKDYVGAEGTGPGADPYPITFTEEDADEEITILDNEFANKATRQSIEIWQRYASPVWMDINPSDTLQKESAREDDDERHICPLQLQVIERAMQLWTNEGDTVLSPYMGIGSEGHVALKMRRKFIGCELKESYFNQAVLNLRASQPEVGLFDALELSEPSAPTSLQLNPTSATQGDPTTFQLATAGESPKPFPVAHISGEVSA